ncbi:hypothetical protein [Natronosalvus halobius]|uniref:hypothetical protein n=1 Tax=Natronosalvus halobius TaxID=2953746 RepID=UPI0020A19D32|nr:hypothetical protein [Natronosalvus halobius]USZ70239.1 hypothetical protein NGM15_08880 [Natronosalvus halobius]
MSANTDTTSGFGVGGRIGWPIGGAVGGVIGAAAFGLLVWFFSPDVIEATIPTAYGLEAAGTIGWAIQLAHGVILGLIFAFVVTRQAVLGLLRTDVETDAIARTGLTGRFVAAGLVFGFAVWAILPMLILPVWLSAVGAGETTQFSALATNGLVGHLLFGTVLGAVFALLVDVTKRTSQDVLGE